MSEISFCLHMPADEAMALAQFVKRLDYGTVTRFANPCATYDGRMENYVMWCAVHRLGRALVEAGVAPR
jgi:hypothetical protein